MNQRNQNTIGKGNERKYQNLGLQRDPPYHKDSSVSAELCMSIVKVEV
jgi:hypothetical protein